MSDCSTGTQNDMEQIEVEWEDPEEKHRKIKNKLITLGVVLYLIVSLVIIFLVVKVNVEYHELHQRHIEPRKINEVVFDEIPSCPGRN